MEESGDSLIPGVVALSTCIFEQKSDHKTRDNSSFSPLFDKCLCSKVACFDKEGKALNRLHPVVAYIKKYSGTHWVLVRFGNI